MSRPIPKNRVLAPKETTLFRTVLQLYEARQWKKALKATDQILKKNPDHGETLSMKGLVLTNMNRKEEGLELVRKGVRLDLTSHICWHVFGLVHKADRNYEEALKCFTQALRFEKDNMNILRDVGYLQMQLRHFDGLVETRQILLRLRPNLRQSWASLAVAYYLNGQLDSSKSVLESYFRTVKEIPPYDPEHSELLLFQVRVLEELGSFATALSLLDENAKARAIVDKLSISTFRARLLQKLGKPDEALAVWRYLIDGNPECYDHYKGFLSTKGINPDSLDGSTRKDAVTEFQTFASQFPKATTPRRILLDLTTGDELRQLVTPYLEQGITRGIPSLFADIKALYSVPEKREIVQSAIEDIKSRLDKGERLTNPSSTGPEPPTSYLWTLYFLAQHYASSPQTIPQALETIEAALVHTPTLPELYMIKARTLKRAGDPLGASLAMSDAWRLDLQDRFLNTKNAIYLLRAGFVDEGNKLLGLFTKKDAASPGADLEDMQSLQYLLEDGDAQDRTGKLHLALKRYHGAFKTFDDVEDDQYDFHSYALRKYTINTYLEFIHVEDNLRKHAAYAKAALAAAKIYIRLHDDPKLVTSRTSHLSEAEKKAAKKAKKAELKLQEDAKKAVALTTTDDKDPPAPKDADPDGSKLLAVSDPLEQAVKLLAPLVALRPELIDTWLVSYDVAIRRKKYLQALRALNHAHGIRADDPELHWRLVDFKLHTDSLPNPLPSHIAPLIASGLANLIPPEQSLEAYNSDFQQRHSASSAHIVSAARGICRIRSPEAGLQDAEELAFGLLRPDVDTSVATALDGVSFLRSIKSPRADELAAACDAHFPFSTVFKTQVELGSLRARRAFGVDDVAEDAQKVEEITL